MEHRRRISIRSLGARAPFLGALACASTPCLAAGVVAAAAPPLFYPSLVVSIVVLMLVGTVRSRRMGSGGQRGVRLEPEPVAMSTSLQAFSAAARATAPPSESIASFAAAAATLHGVPQSAVRVEVRGERAGDVEAASGEVGGAVAEAAMVYESSGGWMPLVAENAALGHVAIGEGLPDLDEPRRAVGDVLCALLALLLKNAAHRDRLAAQAAELDVLRRRLASESEPLRTTVLRPEGFRDFVGASEALRRVLALIERVAPSDVAVLVTGETGTGKEIVARAVHACSPRRDGPLIAVNCPAIPGPLAESELFGHERGAFTDAVAARPGQFELAHGGTIFLDEIADLPLDIQAKLLRVLQEGEVRRVGGHRPRPVDVRTVAATNRDLLVLVREGRFREDLYYRLAAVEIAVPPLRVRHGDVPILASHFLEQATAAYGKALSGFTADAVARLCAYSWPGNVRQLQNVIHRAALLCAGDVVRPIDLAEIAGDAPESPPRFGESIRQEKKRRFLEALHQSGWNQSAAARQLGMSRSNFARMVRALDIAIQKRGRG